VKGIFELSNLQAQLSASAFFIAYGVMSFPAAALLSRRKAVPTVLIALAMMVAGCLLMLWAANIANYTLVLAGLFVLASGITILQVAANPLAAALGRPERSHFRLTFSQAFNSLGTFIGPYLGAVLFLKGVEVKAGAAVSDEARNASLAGIDRAFFWIAGLIILIALLIWAGRKLISAAAEAEQRSSRPLGIGAAFSDALSSAARRSSSTSVPKSPLARRWPSSSTATPSGVFRWKTPARRSACIGAARWSVGSSAPSF
jgi:FHS family L-fucose permease-like MFS transporter